jgi:hypothetical protein
MEHHRVGKGLRCAKGSSPSAEQGGRSCCSGKCPTHRPPGAIEGPQGQERIDKRCTGLTRISTSDLQERRESAMIDKGRQDPQRTHNPSAVGSSPPAPPCTPVACGNVSAGARIQGVLYGAESAARGFNSVAASVRWGRFDLRRRIGLRLDDGVAGGLCERLDVEFWTLAGREDPEVMSSGAPWVSGDGLGHRGLTARRPGRSEARCPSAPRELYCLRSIVRTGCPVVRAMVSKSRS